jgi:hypothetical protein
MVETSQSMNVLGVEFGSKLQWLKQVSNAI